MPDEQDALPPLDEAVQAWWRAELAREALRRRRQAREESETVDEAATE